MDLLKRNENGLTLVELMILTAIMGIFFSILIPLITRPAIKNDQINITVERGSNFSEAGLRYYDIYIEALAKLPTRKRGKLHMPPK